MNNYNKGNNCDTCKNQYLCGYYGDALSCKCIDNGRKCHYEEYKEEIKIQTLKEYSEKYGIEYVINSMSERSIVFSNGWVGSIVENTGTIFDNEGKIISNKKYSVAMCDYDGYFNWNKLNAYGGVRGCIYCDTESEIIDACEIIRKL